MADIKKLGSELREQLFDRLEEAQIVMLGSPVPGEHMQPMAPHADRENDRIWFYTSKHSDLVRAVLAGEKDVHMCLTETDYQACLLGALTQVHEKQIIDRFWSPMVAAWFAMGKNDPDLALLCFRPKSAAIWAADSSPLKVAYEVAMASLGEHPPEFGARREVRFAAG